MSDHDKDHESRSSNSRPPLSNGWVFALSMTAALATGAWLILSEAPGGAESVTPFSVPADADSR
ncbi:MAG: hypothetical protein CMJ42_18510 [Phyllobacteriaceae bacterium]|nr:hypothetical protein [Phyllobacteriaceae bacterium]MBA90193.1 hypothetical protein [Phyllobacteriaceae bacterium]